MLLLLHSWRRLILSVSIGLVFVTMYRTSAASANRMDNIEAWNVASRLNDIRQRATHAQLAAEEVERQNMRSARDKAKVTADIASAQLEEETIAEHWLRAGRQQANTQASTETSLNASPATSIQPKHSELPANNQKRSRQKRHKKSRTKNKSPPVEMAVDVPGSEKQLELAHA